MLFGIGDGFGISEALDLLRIVIEIIKLARPHRAPDAGRRRSTKKRKAKRKPRT